MLTPNQLDALPQPIIDLYAEYEQTVINDIARRLAKLPMTETAAWQMQRLTESGAIYKHALKELAALTGQSEDTLNRLFLQAGVKSIQFDDAIYKAAGLKPLPLNLSPAMVDVLKIGIQKTFGTMKNLTATTAIDASQKFTQGADLAYMQITSGTMSYTQAIRSAIKQVAAQGINTIDYASGHSDHLDVAMRRTVLTGVNNTAGKLQSARADEMEQDLVQTSAHAGARPSHAVWQGRIFSRSGKHSRYPDFVSSTGYGTVTGLCGVNCRHSFYPYFEGVSDDVYTRSELQRYKHETVKYRNKSISMYDATQQQREIERTIRYWKRQADALDAADFDNSFELGKVHQYQALMREFLHQVDLLRQYEREQI